MAIIATQFGHPHGVLGRLVGRLMVRGNGDLNRWVVAQLRSQYQGDANRIVELGPGPGVGLEEAISAFPAAEFWGIDISPEMLSQSRKRNQKHIDSGRLTLQKGGVADLGRLAPIDIVMAVHVLYFWHQPASELEQTHAALRPGGVLALGYQLRANMPRVAQTNFPRAGHILYDSDEEIHALLIGAGFRSVHLTVKGAEAAPEGRLALATA